MVNDFHSSELKPGRPKWQSSHAIFILIVVFSVCTSGCVPLALPTPWFNASGARTNVEKKSLSQFKPGKSSIDDVVLKLGEPDEVGADERELVYCSRKHVGIWALIILAMGGATGGPITRDEFLIFQLDHAGMVTNSLIEHKLAAQGGDPAGFLRTAPSLDLEAKKFNLESGNASIYVNQRGGLSHLGGLAAIALDGHTIGSLAPGRYQFISIPPGEHILTTVGYFENAQIKVNAEEGRNYFVDVSFSRKFLSAYQHVNLTQIGEVEGEKEVTQSKRAEVRKYW